MGQRLVARGKIEPEHGASADLAFHEHNAFVRLNNSVDHRQSKAASFSRPLGGEERLKDARQRCVVHARAIVGDGKEPIFSFMQAMMDVGCVCLKLRRFQRYMDGAALKIHRMPGVRANVHDDLMDLGRVADDDRRIAVDMNMDLDPVRQRRPGESRRLANGGAQIEEFPRLMLLAAEGQYLLDDFLGALGSLEDFVHVRAGLLRPPPRRILPAPHRQ